jgi:hypothetical protein
MTRAEIEKLEEARRNAMLAGDLDTLDSLFAADLTWIHSSCTVDDKASFLQGFSRGNLRCFRLDHFHNCIRLYGSVALVTGLVEMDVEVNGTRRSSTNRFSCLWVTRGGPPQLVSWQSTRVPSPA